jgi:hypothetical protein
LNPVSCFFGVGFFCNAKAIDSGRQEPTITSSSLTQQDKPRMLQQHRHGGEGDEGPTHRTSECKYIMLFILSNEEESAERKTK